MANRQGKDPAFAEAAAAAEAGGSAARGLGRRGFLKAATATGLALAAGGAVVRGARAAETSMGPAGMPAGTLSESELASLPGKRPLIKRAFRAPNFETPVDVFNEFYTPNDAFFVRYHLSDIPEVNATTWKLSIAGDAAATPFELTLTDLKKMEAVELTAVNQCSGNRRGLSNPHVAGVEWGYGAMGNAKWRGVRLRDVLAKAGIKADALEVELNGADKGAVDQTPDFVKSLPMWKALDENTMLAYGMNGQDLPHWNGFPVRMVVPGWTGTYWMKHIVNINVISKPEANFWVKTAYRIPKGKFPVVDRFISQESDVSTPITEMMVNSLITNLHEGQKVRAGQAVEVKGVAWDGGYGIQTVEISTDGGKHWETAELGRNEGRFSWTQWSHRVKAGKKGGLQVLARASNKAGATQVFQAIWNPAGYHHNVVNSVNLVVT